ncbi:hypothetical protein ACPCA8_33795 [Streptomyces capoamus]|uniref:hypothetical protein n=1 Tax=Streptomyces capoamus TaxID=68183 RepID=UPI003C2E9ED8
MRHDAFLDGETEPSDFTGDAPAIASDVEAPAPAQRRRAARRRQLVRWKKNKRRAAIASAVALVGGGLTIAMTERTPVNRVEAATAPDDVSIGTVDDHRPEQNRPASAPATDQDTHRSSHASSRPQSPPTPSTLRVQARVVPAGTTPVIDRPEAAAPGRPAVTPTPQRQPQPHNTATTSDIASTTSDTAPNSSSNATAQQPSMPAPGNDTAGTSQTRPARVPTSPTDVCLLGLCLN